MSRAAIERLRQEFPDAVLSTHDHRGDDTALIAPARLLDVCRFLKEDPALHFDMLVDLTCLDTLGLDPRTARKLGGVTGAVQSQVPGTIAGNAGSPHIPGPASGRFHLVYHLRSMQTGKRLRLRAAVDESEDGDSPDVPSVTSLWKSANWAERETWDMFGIRFKGHPDLRRILMYEEFVGHPLRKDYPKEKRQPLVRRDFT